LNDLNLRGTYALHDAAKSSAMIDDKLVFILTNCSQERWSILLNLPCTKCEPC